MWITSETHKLPEKLPENIINLCRDLDPEVLEYFDTKNAGLQVLIRKAYDLPFVPPFDLLSEDLPAAMTETQKLRYETLISYPWKAYNKIKNLKYRIITPTVEKLNETQETLDQATAQWHQAIVQFQESQTELHKTQAKLQQLEPELEQSRAQLQQAQTQWQQTQAQSHQVKDELQQSQAKLQQSEQDLEQKQTVLQQSQLEIEQLKAQLETAKTEIEAMKSSKFWKLREYWFKLKGFLGLE
jgi:DNA repair exonuclease SbcCD ATPase subunit